MEASYYDSRDNGTVRCLLCPNYCVIADGKSGACRIRGNNCGVLQADAYSELVTLSVDPIEKKPLYHFHPGKPILSTGANGCNFVCGFCQNSDISQKTVSTRLVEPEKLAELAGRDGSIGIAYTYTEPFIWFEYIRDTGKIIRDKGLANVLVTNGYVNEEPLRELLPVIDAMNVDIKSMKQDFYTKICGGKIADVLRTVEIANETCHVEITNLVITGYNDTDEDFERLVDWICAVNPSIPLHLSRYFPQYKFTAPQTSVETMTRAYDYARSRLPYVYVGNMHLEGASDTVCQSCGATLIGRTHYSTQIGGVTDGKCSSCGTSVDIAGI